MPTAWLPRTEHASEACYFCKNHEVTRGFRWETRAQINYATVSTVIPAMLRSNQVTLAPGEAEGEWPEDIDMDVDMTPATEPTHQEPVAGSSTSEPSVSAPSTADASPGDMIKYNQADVERLAKMLKLLPKERELLGSDLMDHNAVDEKFRNTASRKRALTEKFDELFVTDPITNITYCVDINGLFMLLQHPHIAEEWRLFIDGSGESLKAVLVNNGNTFPSVPIAYARNVKETYASMQAILMLTKYHEHNWQICGDLKIIGILMGLKQGYAKHQCFLCLWEGRKDKWHYDFTHKWDPRPGIDINEKISQIQLPLVKDRTKILLPPLHIKLGMVRNFTKKLPRNGEAYKFLVQFMGARKLSESKVENG